MMKVRRRQFLVTMLCVVPITAWAGIVKRRKSDALVYAPSAATAFPPKKSTAAESESVPEFPSPEIVPPKPRTVRRAMEPAAVNENIGNEAAAESEEVIRFDHTKK